MTKEQAFQATIARIKAGCARGDPVKMRAILDEGFAAYADAKPSGLTVLVCGGRDYDDVAYLWSILDKADAYLKPAGGIGTITDDGGNDTAMGGRRTGASYWAAQWARARGKKRMRFRSIEEARPFACIAVRGADDTPKRAREAGVRVWER